MRIFCFLAYSPGLLGVLVGAAVVVLFAVLGMAGVLGSGGVAVAAEVGATIFFG